MASTFFARACQLGAVGLLGAAVKYKYTYEAIPTDAHSSEQAVRAFLSSASPDLYDVAVVGGGIVGVATAREIRAQFPKKRVVLLEKEADVAQHQSSHNSGVIHAGMFYPPGSAMSRLCPRGHDLMMAYCQKHKLPFERVGKIIVASNEKEAPIIEELYEYGKANGVRDLQLLRSEEEIKKLEPNVCGTCALYSPDTGIADFGAVTRHMLKELQSSAHGFFAAKFQFEAMDFVGVALNSSRSSSSSSTSAVEENVVLIRGHESGQAGPEKTVAAHHVITCCGLSNDVIARRSGAALSRSGQKVAQTFSFRGRYYQLRPEARGLVSMNVYPAPDSTKGLSVGVHFTPTVDERRGRQVIVGPGSAVTTHRYGYSPYWFDLEYCWNSAFSRGGWVSLASNFGTVAKTFYTDVSRAAFLQEARKLIPSLKESDIEESFCGVMGVAVRENGALEKDLAMDFAVPRITLAAQADEKGRLPEVKSAGDATGQPLLLNVRNAPSPAATSCMSIAEDIVALAKEQFKW